jgi:hypothetical protein
VPSSQISFDHPSPIRYWADADLNVAFPRDRLAELEADGTIGAVSPTRQLVQLSLDYQPDGGVADPEGQRWELTQHLHDADPADWGAEQLRPLPG